jgi:Na+/melibiose symporter-like transporter
LALACIAFVWVFMLDVGALWGFALICVLSGISLGADMALPASIQADIAQAASSEQGALSGIAFGLWGLLSKLALALAVGLAFPLLDQLGWQQHSPASINGLLWLYAGAPIALKLVVLLWLSAMDKQRAAHRPS